MTVAVLALTVAALNASGQGTAQAPQRPDQRLNTPLPRGDSKPAPGASLDTPTVPAPFDASAEASPTTPAKAALALRIGMEISVKMTEAVDSGAFHNGDTVHAVLAGPVKTSNGIVLREGTRVEGTVVSSARAGLIASGGVLSLQVTHVGGLAVVTDIVDFNGAEGHKDVADSAPAKGSEAGVTAGQVLQFKVLEVGPVPGLAPVTAEQRTAATKATGTPDDKTRNTAQEQEQRNVRATRNTSGRNTPRNPVQGTAPQTPAAQVGSPQ